MKNRVFLCTFTLCVGAALAAALLVLSAQAAAARANAALHCVNTAGSGCAAEYGGNCYSTVQAAVNAAAAGDEIRVAGGNYTAPGGTVAAISKSLTLSGGWNQACSGGKPAGTTTVFDGQQAGTVVTISGPGSVKLAGLTITGGNGSASCGADARCAGGIYASDTDLHLEDSTITGNWANASGSGVSGGGIFIYNAGAVLERNTITHNQAAAGSSVGAGVSISSTQPVTLTNNLIAGNGTVGDSGGVYVDSPAANIQTGLYNNTIADNKNAGVIVTRYATLEMINNIISGHTTGILVSGTLYGAVVGDTNLLSQPVNHIDPSIFVNSLSGDPLFYTDYTLQQNSPAVDAGKDLLWNTLDLRSVYRPFLNKWDLGAFEWHGYSVYIPFLNKN